MTVNRHIKRNAKNALRGQWSKGIAAALILLCVVIALTLLETTVDTILGTEAYFTMLSRFSPVQWLTAHGLYDSAVRYSVLAVVLILEFFLLTPFGFGFLKWAYAIASGERSPITLLFYYYTGFKKYFKSLWVAFSVLLRVVCYTFVFTLPAMLLYGGASYYAATPGYLPYFYLVMVGLSVLLALFGGVLALILSMKYMIVAFLFVEDAQIKVRASIQRSAEIMKQQKRSAASLLLSFVPLLLLSLAYLPLLFVLPYIAVAFAIFAKYLIEKDRREHAAGLQNGEVN